MEQAHELELPKRRRRGLEALLPHLTPQQRKIARRFRRTLKSWDDPFAAVLFITRQRPELRKLFLTRDFFKI